MDRDRGVRAGPSSGPGGKARSGQFTGDTQLSLLSAKNAGHTGLNPIMQAVFSTSTWYAFAGHVMQAVFSTSTWYAFAGHVMQAVFSTSTWYAFAGHVKQPK